MKAKKLSLHEPHGKNRYCGPAAISAITGISTDDAAAVVRHLHPGRGPVKGMHNSELVGALEKLGARVVQVHGFTPRAPKPTLKHFIEGRIESLQKAYLVINVTNHYVAMRGELVTCSLQRRQITHYLGAKCLNRRVVKAWMVIPPEHIALPAGMLAARKQAKVAAASRSRGRAEALRKAHRLHLDIEIDGELKIVSLSDSGHELWREAMIKSGEELAPDASFYDVDSLFYDAVLDGASYGHDWSDTLDVIDRVGRYITAATGFILD